MTRRPQPITANLIIEWIERLKGASLNPEEGVHYGSGEESVTGVTVCWKASPGAIEHALKRRDSLIIGHETLFSPWDSDFNPRIPPGWENWEINRRRRERLDSGNITFLRLHTSVDQLFVTDEMAAWLGLGAYKTADNGARFYPIEMCSFRELVERVKRHTGLERIRVSAAGDWDRRVSRVGLLTGGGGLFTNVRGHERHAQAGCDVFITGETDSYGFRFAAEYGIPMIETTHEDSENPGIRLLADRIRTEFTNLDVSLYKNTCIWTFA